MKIINHTPEQISDIKQQYINGVSIKNLCHQYNIGDTYLRKLLKKEGVFISRKHKTRKQENEKRDTLIERCYKEGSTIKEVAIKFSLSQCTVKRILKGRGLSAKDRKRTPFTPRIDKETLERLYRNEKLSAQTIAEKYGVSDSTVWNWIWFYEIPAVPRTERLLNRPCYGHPSWKGGITPFRTLLTTRLLGWRKQVLVRDNWTCQRCSSKRELEVHHTTPLRFLIKQFKESFPTIDISTPEGLDFAVKTIVSMHSVEMGICLCRNCHEEIDEWRKRFNSPL